MNGLSLADVDLSLGDPEIPRIVLEELIANAFIHRDYFRAC